MPELAEVEFYRKQWSPGFGQRVLSVKVHGDTRVFRDCCAQSLCEGLEGRTLKDSFAHGKQMLFQFSGGHWLGVHLGMTGKLFFCKKPYGRTAWDHLVLDLKTGVLVFSDPRQFGRLLHTVSSNMPDWWMALPPSILSDDFKYASFEAFLKRRKRTRVKPLLLMQEQFPGIGNWMADEILWRAEIHPELRPENLSDKMRRRLFQKIVEVSKDAIAVIGSDWGTPPDSWLFNHRWKDGGICPKSKQPLVRETIGGRTTCWSPAVQSIA